MLDLFFHVYFQHTNFTILHSASLPLFCKYGTNLAQRAQKILDAAGGVYGV